VTTKSLVPVEEYLRLSFDGPDREYLDGEIVERNVGGSSHSDVLAALVLVMHELRRQGRLRVLPEMRLKVSETRYRVADVAVYEGGRLEVEVPDTPPLITIEIVSRDDRHTEIVEKLDEYFRWGVRHIWLIDPFHRKMYGYGPSGLREVAVLAVPEYELQIRISDLV